MAFAWLYCLSFTLFFLPMTNQEIICPFNSIYQLGDSTSGTGNLIRIPGIGPTIPAARSFYGITFPGQPTGRWSDGRLIIDYIAMKLGLPLLNQYLNQNASFENGVNFAVAGATALNVSFLTARGVTVPDIDVTPLSDQLNWFRQYLSSICPNPTECSNKLKKTLTIVGDIGNNDIDYGYQNETLQEIMAYIPFIPRAIANVTREIIRLGATNIVVPGTFPLGCFPMNLVLFPDGTKDDDQGCLTSLNSLSIYFNALLQNTLNLVRLEFPFVKTVYADYYNAFQFILRNGPAFGFDRATLLKACCGIGGLYNYDRNRFCGSPGVPLCANPARYISWEGNHLTQEVHRRITEILLPSILLQLRCSR